MRSADINYFIVAFDLELSVVSTSTTDCSTTLDVA